MANVTIPIEKTPSYLIDDIVLNGTSYKLIWNWNTREELWHLTVQDADGTDIVSGIMVALNYPLLGQYVGHGLPDGDMYALDPSSNVSSIRYDDLKDRCEIVYDAAI